MRSICVLLLLFCALTGQAQDFTITKVETAGDLINVYYELVDTVSRRTYTVQLFSSRDNFVSPLDNVSGDMGLEVKPGGNKKISWNAKEELGSSFKGNVALEVRGRLYIPFVRLDGFYNSFKRDKPYEITWSGGTEQNILNFDLYKEGEKVTSFPNIANVGHYTLTLPQSVKPGNGYTFRISDSKNKDQIVNTAPFAVKRKVPLLVKALPIIAVGVVIATLPKGSSNDPGDTKDPIPEAPPPP